MQNLLYDFRMAARSLMKARGLSATAIVVLAAGMAAATGVFVAAKAVLFTPVPYRAPDRLVMIFEAPRSGPDQYSVAAPGNIDDWRRESRSFEGIAAFNLSALAFDAEGGRERVAGAAVTANYFDLLAVAPALGRGFQPGEDAIDGSRVIVISDGFWRRQFGADPTVIGTAMRTGTASLTIIGVMPPDFRDPEERDFGRSAYWMPLRLNWSAEGRGGRYLRTFARLRDASRWNRRASISARSRTARRPRSRRRTGHGRRQSRRCRSSSFETYVPRC